MFCYKDVGLLDYFIALGSNVLNFIWRIYVTRMLCFEIISFEKFILLDDVSLMTCCYTLRENLCN